MVVLDRIENSHCDVGKLGCESSQNGRILPCKLQWQSRMWTLGKLRWSARNVQQVRPELRLIVESWKNSSRIRRCKISVFDHLSHQQNQPYSSQYFLYNLAQEKHHVTCEIPCFGRALHVILCQVTITFLGKKSHVSSDLVLCMFPGFSHLMPSQFWVTSMFGLPPQKARNFYVLNDVS